MHNIGTLAWKKNKKFGQHRMQRAIGSPGLSFTDFDVSLSSVTLYPYVVRFVVIATVNTFTAIVNLSQFNNSYLKSPTSTLVDLTFQSRALRSFSLNQLRNLSL